MAKKTKPVPVPLPAELPPAVPLPDNPLLRALGTGEAAGGEASRQAAKSRLRAWEQTRAMRGSDDATDSKHEPD
jgi:hypothetical protein